MRSRDSGLFSKASCMSLLAIGATALARDTVVSMRLRSTRSVMSLRSRRILEARDRPSFPFAFRCLIGQKRGLGVEGGRVG